MKPSQVAARLVHIATKLKDSKRPDRGLVAAELKSLVRKIAIETEEIFVEIKWPPSMSMGEAIKRAYKLTGAFSWFEEQSNASEGWACGNLSFPIGTYTGHPKSFGPDDAGVEVNWDVP